MSRRAGPNIYQILPLVLESSKKIIESPQQPTVRIHQNIWITSRKRKLKSDPFNLEIWLPYRADPWKKPRPKNLRYCPFKGGVTTRQWWIVPESPSRRWRPEPCYYGRHGYMRLWISRDKYLISITRYFRSTGRGGHAQLFLESAIAIPQLEGRTSAIAISQLLKECCSTTATPQFHNLRVSPPQFPAYFWPRSSLKLHIFLTPGVFCYSGF